MGGDALIRAGMKSHSGVSQLFIIAAGALMLLAYGVFVNVTPTDFGRALGMYVVIFFVVAQMANFFIFGIHPSRPIVAGGMLIIAGGLVTALWKP